MVSSAEDERTASRVAVERAAEALDADVAALLSGGEVVASVGLHGDPLLLAALGLVLAWSSTAFYSFYEDVPRIWSLTAVEDQNVAGVIMMVEQSMTLVLVMVWVFVRMLTRSEEDELRRERLEEAQVPASNVDVISTGP